MYRKSIGWKRVITLDWKFFSPLTYAKTFLTSSKKKNQFIQIDISIYSN